MHSPLPVALLEFPRSRRLDSEPLLRAPLRELQPQRFDRVVWEPAPDLPECPDTVDQT